MNGYKMLLRLYPRVWRARYEEEFLVVLASHPFSLFEGIDVVRGALDAHLHPRFGMASMPLSERMKRMLSTLRCSLLAMFCAYVGFILAGMGFQKMTEAADLQEVVQAHSIVGLSFHLIVIGAIAALLAVLAGGLPIVAAVVRSALARRRYGPLFLLAVPILAFAAFFLTMELLKVMDRPIVQQGWLLILYRSLFFGAWIASAIVSAGAVCLAVVHSEISEQLLRFAVLPSILLTVSMALILAATLTWGLGLSGTAPQLFSSNDGLVGTSTVGTWLGIVIAMSVATALSTISLLRGLSAHTALRSAAV